jgi:hypothetical protein
MRSHGPADASNGAATTEADLVSDREMGHWRRIGTLGDIRSMSASHPKAAQPPHRNETTRCAK